MPTCPSGHDSASTDFCDVCGMRMDGAAAPASSSSSAPSADVAPAPTGGEPCPQCGAGGAKRQLSTFAVVGPRADKVPGPCGSPDCACRTD